MSGKARCRRCCLVQMACGMLMCADDVVLLANNPAAPAEPLVLFCTDWEMDVNLAQTEVVMYNSRADGRAASQPQHTWLFQRQPVEQAQQYKHL